jgi:hypothetical protein
MLLYLARPEYLIAFIIASCLSIYYNTKRKKRLLLLLPMVFLLVYIGSRTTNVSGVDRGFFAYAQHYIITYKIWNRNESIDIYQYIDKLPNIFGKSFTFIGSVFYNPVEAGRHIITCTGYYILTLIKSTEDFFLPSIWLQPVGKIKHILFLLIIIAIIVTIRKYNFTNFFKDNKFLFIPILVFFSATAFSNFIIGYNPHYFQLHFILYIVLLSAILFSKKFPKVNSWILLIVCISTTAFIPPIGRYSFQHVDFLESKHLPIQQLAGILNNLNDGNKHTLLAAQTNLHFIVEGNNFNGLDCFAVSMPFTTFINENKVDFIYVNEQMLNDNKLNKDTEWKLFISHPESHGFIKTSIGNSNNYLLIKNK